MTFHSLTLPAFGGLAPAPPQTPWKAPVPEKIKQILDFSFVSARLGGGELKKFTRTKTAPPIRKARPPHLVCISVPGGGLLRLGVLLIVCFPVRRAISVQGRAGWGHQSGTTLQKALMWPWSEELQQSQHPETVSAPPEEGLEGCPRPPSTCLQALVATGHT